MQALLYRRGGVRAPRGWLGRVHGRRGWRGWDAGVTGGEAGLETLVDGVDLIEYVVMRLLREACFLDLIQGIEIEVCVGDGGIGNGKARGQVFWFLARSGRESDLAVRACDDFTTIGVHS